MTYYEDLSTYDYLGGEEVISSANGFIVFEPAYTRLNVGWLDAERPFPQGTSQDELVSALLWVTSGQTINLTRGWHWCGFCFDEGKEVTGNGEVRVPGGSGIMYAAPVMISHYVAEHRYAPPDAFVTAVLAYMTTGDHLDEPSWIPADAERALF
ncbi:hypothetical protein [Actinomadura sp. HBU206391]|uniref:DUF7919 family protein n=1 Tax=Actinomadura sp. HBU206391 TaxID=2731692 RepID=UPI001650676B|nr:hypothetical protein [Actinomadura sp. HBU206391]MBC6463686.1 hypothetical protein [Actinomadura sp. HBU206391]